MYIIEAQGEGRGGEERMEGGEATTTGKLVMVLL